jgi:hypothetical protein
MCQTECRFTQLNAGKLYLPSQTGTRKDAFGASNLVGAEAMKRLTRVQNALKIGNYTYLSIRDFSVIVKIGG